MTGKNDVCSNSISHVTKMTAMHMYGKNKMIKRIRLKTTHTGRILSWLVVTL